RTSGLTRVCSQKHSDPQQQTDRRLSPQNSNVFLDGSDLLITSIFYLSKKSLDCFLSFQNDFSLCFKGHYTFKCPALVEGTTRCNKAWSYQEVRRLADLSVEEMQHFEDNMARMAAARHCEFQPCPQCKTNMERKDLSNLSVICIICTADQGGTYQFCWQCQKPWKGSAPRSDRCGNDDCINRDLQLLQTCKSIDLPEVAGVTSCPSIRLCPTCGMKIEHSRQNCKNVICPRCHKEFCFVCLKLTRQCCKTSSPFRICPGGVAPRQTSIPVWQRK
uniref:RING-type domain-containing protein n=1 Tax=Amphiprion ocellaris TaxID=80972 RepID=A0A3Q1B6I3_AMPOC